ncbi:AraC family transcriptional regulator [Paenibacillus sp. WQ 127069]|uniref:AraC family transcriptional regulator n=1 Tax=Paenibacillus baimaensis TaxID=2982185 RepID=A0ABT2UIG0_9BACL|nr:AraC family transcriptional regulator [Paenibacillus sp. WQ 127069]MCU6794433.1 AraC family transcriptional regulator [Paenibacillus sp. WQ 127069]
MKIKRIFGRKTTLLQRMIMLTLAVGFLPTLIVGISSYLFSASTLQNEVNRAHVQLLENTSATIDRDLQNIQDSTLQLLFHPLFGNEALQRGIKENESEFNMQVVQFFSTFQSNHKLILDISMYVKDNYLLSSSFGLFKITPIYDRNRLNEVMTYPKEFQWKNTVFQIRANDAANGVTFICRLPLQALNPVGLMLVRIDEKLFQDALQRSVVYPGQTIAIVDKEGKTVTSSSVSAIPSQLLERIQQKNVSEHKLNYNWNNRDYLVTTLTSTYTGWKYIDLIPVDELNAKSAGIGVITAVVLAIVLMIALVFTFLGTQWVYRPIANLMIHMKRDSAGSEADEDEIGYVKQTWLALKDETRQLQDQLSHQLPIIQESFVMQMLQGNYLYYAPSELGNLFERYGLPQQAQFAIFIVTYDSSTPGKGKFSDQDRDLVIFAMKNIITDLVHANERVFLGITINLLNDQIAVLLWNHTKIDLELNSAMTAEWKVLVKGFVEETRSVLSDYLRLPVTAGLGTVTHEIRDLPQVYHQAVSALYSRLVVGGEQVIDPENDFLKVSESFRYPIELEQHYEESLKQGDLEESKRMLDEFSNYVVSATHVTKVIQMSYTQLLGTTIRTMYLLGIDLDSLYKGEEPYEYLRKFQNMDDLNHWFLDKLITPIVTFVHNKTFVKHEHIIDKVTAFIQENYHLDISQDQCAHSFGISRTHLSKLFKKFQHISFSDYVTQVRIERAKKLLRDTDIPVADISEKVGYLHTQNFIRVFKKNVGLTPGQFRDEGE